MEKILEKMGEFILAEEEDKPNIEYSAIGTVEIYLEDFPITVSVNLWEGDIEYIEFDSEGEPYREAIEDFVAVFLNSNGL